MEIWQLLFILLGSVVIENSKKQLKISCILILISLRGKKKGGKVELICT
jgi:hypothetical protein